MKNKKNKKLNKSNSINTLELYNRKYNNNSVAQFLAEQKLNGSLIKSNDKKYLDKSKYPTSTPGYKEQQQNYYKEMLLDASIVRNKEILDIPYKDLLAITTKTCIPTQVKGEVDHTHQHAVSFMDIVVKANQDLSEVIDI